MLVQSIVVLVTISGVYASPVVRREDCTEACSNAYNTCRIQPNANRSTCASEYAQCLGYSPFDNSGSLVTPTACSITITATPSPTPSTDACASACSNAYNTCRSQPNANRATCASEYSQCLGYLPFNDEGSLVTPTACSITTAAPTSTVTPTPDACASACSNAYNICRGKPDANRATCASEYSQCLGYIPFNSEGSLVTPTACSITASATSTATASTTTSKPNACAIGCSRAYDTCHSKPDANRATCAAEYSSCLGYLPFGNEGSLITPTACSIATTTSVATSTPMIAATHASVATPTSTVAASTTLTATPTNAPKQEGGWTVKQLIRYCSEDGTGCDYNFAISTNDGGADERCTVIRTNVTDAPTESWYNIPCTTGSAYQISWGYSAQFDVPFAVMTVVNVQAKAQAYFGISDINGKPVTPNNPRGSGNFGDIGPQPIYTF